jgi:hypothetical protein
LEQAEESQKKTLGEVIEELCMRSFPKIDNACFKVKSYWFEPATI